jgi:hypothetical protein
MTSGPSGWSSIAIAVASGVFTGGTIAAFITTYGGKGRERRKVRSEAMAALLACEQTRRSQPVNDRLTNPNREGIAQLQAMCLLACIPRDLVRMYEEADQQWRIVPLPKNMLSPQTREEDIVLAEFQLAIELIDRAADLLNRALWHPRRSALLRRLRVRKLRKMRYHVFRQGKPLLGLNGWYRFWRALSNNLTRRDRVGVRIRATLRLADPLERKSRKYQRDQASRRPELPVGAPSPGNTAAINTPGIS